MRRRNRRNRSAAEITQRFQGRIIDYRQKPGEGPLANVVERNIHALIEIGKNMDARRTLGDRVADVITRLSGSMSFIWLHVVWFAAWIAINVGWTPVKVFDPFPFSFLTMVVSLEAIFLATFVLISQNRMTEVADQRADLDLQINLLAEYEITRVLKLVDAIADHLGLEVGGDPEVDELKQDVNPQVVIQEMHDRKQEMTQATPGLANPSPIPSDTH